MTLVRFANADADGEGTSVPRPGVRAREPGRRQTDEDDEENVPHGCAALPALGKRPPKRTHFKVDAELDGDDEDGYLMPLAEVKACELGKRSRSLANLKQAPPKFVACNAAVPATFTGYSVLPRAKDAVSAVCHKAAAAIPAFCPTVCIVFATRGISVSGSEIADAARSCFPGSVDMQVLFGQMIGNFARDGTDHPGVVGCNFMPGQKARFTETVCVTLVQEPGLFARAFWRSESPPDLSAEDRAAALEKDMHDSCALLPSQPIAGDGVATGVTICILGQDGQVDCAKEFLHGDTVGGYMTQPFQKSGAESSLIRAPIMARPQGATQSDHGFEGVFGIQLAGDERVRFSIVTALPSDKKDDGALNRRVEELKRRVAERNAVEGPTEPVLLIGLVCAARSAGVGMNYAEDFGIVPDAFPGCPVIGAYCMSEVLPPRLVGHRVMSFGSSWLLIERVLEPQRRNTKLGNIAI